jgi:hypothetical protein
LTGDPELVDILRIVPEMQRYTYIFDGERQLIDWILVSPLLERRVVSANILHVNAAYSNALRYDVTPDGLPFRSSDHDIPIVVLASADSGGEYGPSMMPSDEELGPASRSVDQVGIELPEGFRLTYRRVLLVSLIAVAAGFQALSILIGRSS